jgi:nucleotide-binding universal stress UspA family protein
VTGVDASREAARAAALGWTIAEAAGVECRLVHAVQDQAQDVAPLQLPMDLAPMATVLRDAARREIPPMLRGVVPDSVILGLEVRFGAAPTVLADAARDAELLVIGGKHHSALNRWFGGRTAHHLLRTLDTPVLVAAPGSPRPRRILAAVDLGPTDRATLAVAQRYADLFDGELLVLHAVEPLPATLKASLLVEAVMGDDVVFERSAEAFEEGVWPWVVYGRADRVLRRGPAAEVIRDQARAWRADLVVVGSHGKGVLDRLLVGSTTHRLVDDLPASMIVVPAQIAVPATEGAPLAAPALAVP